jgi:outer membrane protein TolC
MLRKVVSAEPIVRARKVEAMTGLANSPNLRTALFAALLAIAAGAAPPQLPPAQASGRNAASLPPALPDSTPPSATESRMAASTPEVALFPGQVVQPIDLASTLRMAGGRDLDVATARQEVLRSLANLQEAYGLWLPSFFTGPTFYSLNGQVQAINGQIQTVHRDSLSLGTTATLANSFPAPPPGSGYPPLNSLSGVMRISDAIYQARSSKRFVAANEAGIGIATNNALLAASEAYFDLQLAAGSLAIAREAAGNADLLAGLTGSYARSGAGLEADHRRILAEARSRQRSIRAAAGQLKVASAELIRRLVLDPHVVVAPVEPAEAVIRLVSVDVPLDDLICQAWRGRPELARAREMVEASVLQLKQARLRPFVPSLAVSYSGAAFGGGQNSTLANFGGRNDFAASLFWDLRGFGLIDRAAVKRRSADKNTADIEMIRVRAQVANDVVGSFESSAAATGQIEEARESVDEARQSLDLNLTNIRRGAGLPGATRPIEVLQPIQALAQARTDYLNAVLAFNRAQFRLYHAIGQPPMAAPPPTSSARAGSGPPN